jgi:hypothetical protein
LNKQKSIEREKERGTLLVSSLEVLQKIGRDKAEAVAMAFMAMKMRRRKEKRKET